MKPEIVTPLVKYRLWEIPFDDPELKAKVDRRKRLAREIASEFGITEDSGSGPVDEPTMDGLELLVRDGFKNGWNETTIKQRMRYALRDGNSSFERSFIFEKGRPPTEAEKKQFETDVRRFIREGPPKDPFDEAREILLEPSEGE